MVELTLENTNTRTKAYRAESIKKQIKHCPVCKVIKPFSDFYKNLKSPLGVESRCKACCRIKAGVKNYHLVKEVIEERKSRGVKYCPCCKKEVAISDFYSGKRGLRYSCKSCGKKNNAGTYPKYADMTPERVVRRKANSKKSSGIANKKARESLNDGYIKMQLLVQNPLLKREDIPQGMIETKRLIIKIKREIKNVKNNKL